MMDRERVARLQSKLRENPNDVESGYALACALERLGDLEEAEKWFQRVEEMLPDSLEAELARKRRERLGESEEFQEIFLEPLDLTEVTLPEKKARCFYHLKREASIPCFRCQKPLCRECVISEGGAVLCESCYRVERAKLEWKPPEGLGRKKAWAALGIWIFTALLASSSLLMIYSAAPAYLPWTLPHASGRIFWTYLLFSAVLNFFVTALFVWGQERHPPKTHFEAFGLGLLSGGGVALWLEVAFPLWSEASWQAQLAGAGGHLALLGFFGGLESWVYYVVVQVLSPVSHFGRTAR